MKDPPEKAFPSLVEKIHFCLSEIDANVEKPIVTK
jgi:hypothetical protein